MPVRYPSHLYIRVDRSLRADLISAAEAAGQNASAFARGILRAALQRRHVIHIPAAAALTESAALRPGDEGWLTFRGEIRQRGGDR